MTSAGTWTVGRFAKIRFDVLEDTALTSGAIYRLPNVLLMVVVMMMVAMMMMVKNDDHH